jgi:hypothetical protein
MTQNFHYSFVIQLLMDNIQECAFLGKISVPALPHLNAFEFFSLRSLPMEMVLHNSRFLPPESAVSLSLYCRPVYSALGTQYLEDLRSKEESTAFNHERFITNLERDLPDKIVCH